jgi:thiamine pyrophosphate-dependent acetolactate synthase large subunit-like protein
VTKMTGKRALLEQLVADGVRHIFGNPGTTEQAFQDLLQEFPGITYVLCLHEGVAVSMADAYARATGRPAFVQLHIAPGLGNAMGMLYNAHASHSPLVVYVGQSATEALFQEPLLSADLVAMAGPVSKWAVQIDHAADVPQAVRRAMDTAAEPPRGPTVLAIPIDVMEEMADVDIQPTAFTRWAVHPDPDALDEAAELLASSRSPLVVLGDGVALSGAQDEAAALAEELGAPVWLGYSTEVNIRPDHPHLAGTLPFTSASAPRVTDDLLAGHDVVLVLGSPVFRFIFPRPGSPVPPGPRVIQVDLDSWELGKNAPGVLGIRGDVLVAATGLLDRLRSRGVPGAADRAREVAAAVHAARQARLTADEALDAPAGGPIPVARAMRELAAAIPADAAIFEEAMTSAAAFSRHVTTVPGRYFRARGGGIGPGIPGAIGLKLAMPERPVLGVVSDGSSLFAITALWTAAHHAIPVVWVVINNGSYRILKENLAEYLGPDLAGRRFVELDLDGPALRFDDIARSFGVHGERVERIEDLRPAVERALALNRPAVVDVIVSGELPDARP